MLQLSRKQKTLLADTSLTKFQRVVYKALCGVPRGKVTSYKALAKSIHCKSSQAIGQALRRNPFAPTFPCHRVVSSNRKIGGFQGQVYGSNIDRKIDLLKSEGISFDKSGKISESCMFVF
jgi:methylated-DNA-[protein]-cysteine S-methyltransferase